MTGLLQDPTSYGDVGLARFLRQAFLASAGHLPEDVDRPVVGIGHTISDYTTCHRDMSQLVSAVVRGVAEAGGVPMVFGSMSLAETFVAPTTMLYRNLLAMEVEEQLRSQPMDAAVLVGGCDKTVPAQMMAAFSADFPFVQLVVGPMRCGSWRGERLGACTDCRRHWADYRAGRLDDAELSELTGQLAPTSGTCMVMGTASSMAAIAEVMGVAPHHSATAPSPSGDRLRIGRRAGRLAVDVARRDWRPSRFVTRQSFENAATLLAAIGGSTNAVIHLLALAGRTSVDFGLDDLAELLSQVPVIVDCKPTGSGYMEDWHAAGGVPATLNQLREELHLEAGTIEGAPLGERLRYLDPAASPTSPARSLASPVTDGGDAGLVVLRGSLAPRGALIKAGAASAELAQHRGPALVFESLEDAARRLDDPELEVTPNHVLVLRNAGPVACGMPEAGALPIPRRLAAQGVRDMVRVSDARMSGTAFGTVVLHVAPEGAIGGPLALVRDGDPIVLDVPARTVDLDVPAETLRQRAEEWRRGAPPNRGYSALHARSVLQADAGADLDFLTSAHQHRAVRDSSAERRRALRPTQEVQAP